MHFNLTFSLLFFANFTSFRIPFSLTVIWPISQPSIAIPIIWLKSFAALFRLFHFVGPCCRSCCCSCCCCHLAAQSVESLSPHHIVKIYERLLRFKLNSIFCQRCCKLFSCCCNCNSIGNGNANNSNNNSNKLFNNKVFVDSCILWPGTFHCFLLFLPSSFYFVFFYTLKIDFPFTSRVFVRVGGCVCVCVSVSDCKRCERRRRVASLGSRQLTCCFSFTSSSCYLNAIKIPTCKDSRENTNF